MTRRLYLLWFWFEDLWNKIGAIQSTNLRVRKHGMMSKYLLLFLHAQRAENVERFVNYEISSVELDSHESAAGEDR